MRRGCIGCDNVTVGSDRLTICDVANHPEKAPVWCPERKVTAAKPAVTWLLVVLCCVVFGVGGYSIGHTAKDTAVVETGTLLASQQTVIYPSYLTYADQTRLELGTGLAGTDFIYAERKTGIDALTLMAIAVHESSEKNDRGVMVPGTNYWSRVCNNVMSLGITTVNPDRTVYSSKTMNVLITAQWLRRAYLTEGGTYYHGGLTQWEIGQSYAWDGSWAKGVTAALKDLESKLTETQRMKRTLVKTGTFQPDVVWDEIHMVVGWTWYKTNSATAVAGR